MSLCGVLRVLSIFKKNVKMINIRLISFPKYEPPITVEEMNASYSSGVTSCSGENTGFGIDG